VIDCCPTGPGVSTRFDALMNDVDGLQNNVFTIDNPDDYEIDNSTEIKFNPKARMTLGG